MTTPPGPDYVAEPDPSTTPPTEAELSGPLEAEGSAESPDGAV
jgi:hypothetical protein